MNLKTFCVVAGLGLCGAVWAQSPAPAADPTATPRIDQRQTNQQNRINQGVASGQLTPKETSRLEKRENKIAANEAADKASGKVTPAERKSLRKEENRTSKAIYRDKHNGQAVAPAAK